MTFKTLEKQNEIRDLLESPAPVVVGKLIDELRTYMTAIEAVYDENEVCKKAVINYLNLKENQRPNDI